MAKCEEVINGVQPKELPLPTISSANGATGVWQVLSWEEQDDYTEEDLVANGKTISECLTDPGELVTAEILCVAGTEKLCAGDVLQVTDANFEFYSVRSGGTRSRNGKYITQSVTLRHKCGVNYAKRETRVCVPPE